MNLERKNYFSGAPMEQIDGYSRMVQKGPFLYCGGTTSVLPDGGVVAEGDSYGQVKYVLEKLIGIVKEAGGLKEDIYSVKIYATPEYDNDKGLKAFEEIFEGIQPLLTCVTIHKLTRPTQLVEIELNAVSGCSKSSKWEGISLERTNYPYEDKDVPYSQMVQIGPFLHIGQCSDIKEDGLALLKEAGFSANDVVKVKEYMTESTLATRPTTYELFVGSGIVYSKILVDALRTPDEHMTGELFAIKGCGGNTILSEWSGIDFRKKPSSKKDGLCAKYILTGPFLFGGLIHSVDEQGNVVGIQDSERQESYVVKTFTEDMKEFGYEPEDMVKFKAYYTKEFGPLYGETETPYYEQVYKPIKPLYTGVYVSKVGMPEEIFEMEMMAIK